MEEKGKLKYGLKSEENLYLKEKKKVEDALLAAEGEETRRLGRGRIASVQGPVVDCWFDNFEDMPALFDVIEVKTVDGTKVVWPEKARSTYTLRLDIKKN